VGGGRREGRESVGGLVGRRLRWAVGGHWSRSWGWGWDAGERGLERCREREEGECVLGRPCRACLACLACQALSLGSGCVETAVVCE
jgi:hypothetical protein